MATIIPFSIPGKASEGQFDDSIGKKDAEILARRQIYVAMTRAQEYLSLYIHHQSKLTSELKNYLSFDIFNQ